MQSCLCYINAHTLKLISHTHTSSRLQLQECPLLDHDIQSMASAPNSNQIRQPPNSSLCSLAVQPKCEFISTKMDPTAGHHHSSATVSPSFFCRSSGTSGQMHLCLSHQRLSASEKRTPTIYIFNQSSVINYSPHQPLKSTPYCCGLPQGRECCNADCVTNSRNISIS